MGISKEEYTFLSTLLLEESGLELGQDKEYLLEGRLQPIIDEKKMNGFSELIINLRNDLTIKKAVIQAMTTNESLFFRDGRPFEELKKNILPEIYQNKTDKTLNIWSAACSTGQEPYSIGMAIKDSNIPFHDWKLQIFATDICTPALSRAATGVYSDFEVRRGLDDYHLNRYFLQKNKDWEIKPEIREMVSFSELNLVQRFHVDTNFDVIFCRNVLIYFPLEIKQSVIQKLTACLRPGGYLILGGAESHCDQNAILSRAHETLPIFRKI